MQFCFLQKNGNNYAHFTDEAEDKESFKLKYVSIWSSSYLFPDINLTCDSVPCRTYTLWFECGMGITDSLA